MDRELDLLLGKAIDSLVKLDLLVCLQAHPGLAQAPDEIAGLVRRPSQVVASALAELAELRLVERFPIGRGRLAMYGSAEDPHVKGILELLHAQYQQGGEARAQLVRKTLRLTEVTGNRE